MTQIVAYRSKRSLDVSNSSVRIALLPTTAISSTDSMHIHDTVTLGSGAAARDYVFAIQYRYGSTEWIGVDDITRRCPAATITLQLTRGLAAWLIARMFQHLPGQSSNTQNVFYDLSRDAFRSAVSSGSIGVSSAGVITGTLGLRANENDNAPNYIGLVECGHGVNHTGFLADDAVEYYYDHLDISPQALAAAQADGLDFTNSDVMRSFAEWADAFATRTAYFSKYFPVNVKDFALSISRAATNVDNLFANAQYSVIAKAILPNGETQQQSVDPRIALMRILDAFANPYGALETRHYVPHNDSELFWDAISLRGRRIGVVEGSALQYTTLPTDFTADTDAAFLLSANARQTYFKGIGATSLFEPIEYCYSITDSDFPKDSPLGQALTMLAATGSDVWAHFIMACKLAFEASWESEVLTQASVADFTPVLDTIMAEGAYLDAQASARATTIMNVVSDAKTTLGEAIATAQDDIGSHLTDSVATLIATISAIDFDQTPTMGLANLIQSQNRVTQALILALLRKSSSRAWFTSLIDKIGDANALLIDDTEIASIAEKAYQGDAVSNDEIHATPREAYKELFNDKGVNNG